MKLNLSDKDKRLLKLALWAGLVVWMLCYFVFGLVASQKVAGLIKEVLSHNEVLAGIMGWLAPIWLIFTILFTIVLVARWARRRLQ